MDAKALEAKLRRLGACSEARAWAKGKSLAEVAATLHRADWWLWLAAKVGVDRRSVVQAACSCARTALKHVPEGEERPRRALDVAEAWTRGEASLEDVRVAAYAAAAAAYDAAYDADYDAAYAASAAAAYDAAAAAYAAAYADDDDDANARADALRLMVPLVMEHLPPALLEARLRE
jgi:hypothetical protein